MCCISELNNTNLMCVSAALCMWMYTVWNIWDEKSHVRMCCPLCSWSNPIMFLTKCPSTAYY